MISLNKTAKFVAIVFTAVLPFAANAQTNPADGKEWIAKSNSYTKMMLDIDKKYSPEFGSQQGFAYYDTLISVPTLANLMAERKEEQDAVTLLKQAKQKETNSAVKQDIDILVNKSELGFRQDDS